MGVSVTGGGQGARAERLPKGLMQLKLHNGEAVWVMANLGFQEQLRPNKLLRRTSDRTSPLDRFCRSICHRWRSA